MPLEIPRAYHRFDQTFRYLAQVLKPAVQDLPLEPADLALKCKLSLFAEDPGDGRRSTTQNQAVVYLAFDRALRPLTELTRQVLSSMTVAVGSVEDLTHLQGQYGECRFGPPNPFTGYQPVVAWRSADVPAWALGAIPLGNCEPPPYLFRLQGTHFVLRYTVGRKHEDGIFDACAGLRLTGRLLQHPHRAVGSLDLMNETGEPTIRRPADRQEVSDQKAIADIARRIVELSARIDRAREDDPTMVPVYEKERQQLRDYLDQARDGRGRLRRLDAGDPAEAARKTIVNDCGRAWKQLVRHRMPELARFLKEAIRINRDCCVYHPPVPAPDWIF
jgi:hypothetical protein